MKKIVTLAACAVMTGFMSGCALFGGKTTPAETFTNSLYRDFPTPLQTEDDVLIFNIFYCLNAPDWIEPSEECAIVKDAE